MARTRYYRTKRVYPKQKWLPVNNEIVIGPFASLNANSYAVMYKILTQNEVRTTTDGGGNISGASIVKTGRFKFKGTVFQVAGADVTHLIGLAYIPEGYTIPQTSSSNDNIGECFFYRHPEWILAWTRMDYNNAAQRNEFSLSSKLKRNLNTGDQIIAFRICINRATSGQPVSSVVGTVSYVCRTN